ncbi:MICOS complex subunit MIC60 [Meyerozyma sp. JA9]|nr:MICOS complex subunit MIC60 [Meyerozyma sp. JA9]
MLRARFSTSRSVLTKVVTPPPAVPQVLPPPVKPPKKSFSVSRFLLSATLIGSLAYGGTLYVATKNEKVMDYVIDYQPPFYEEILRMIETGSVDEIRDAWDSLRDRVSNVDFSSSRSKIDKFANDLENRGEQLIQKTRQRLGQDTAPTPHEQLQKPVETTQKSPESLPLLSYKGINESVHATVASFNDLIKSIDISGPGSNDLVKAIQDNVAKLSAKVDALTASFDEELQKNLKVSQNELLSSYTKKELELTENLLHQYNTERAQLEKKLNARLEQEIASAKEAISQAAVNAVTMVRIEQTKNFEKLVKDKVDGERSGRLANLDKLSSRLDELEHFAESLEQQIVANHNRSTINRSLAELRSLISSTEGTTPKQLAPYLGQLVEAVRPINDELLEATLKEIVPLLQHESSHSILSTSQLLARWELLSPELRSASLLPPNAGLLGHFTSFLFSKLLLPVKGAKPNGKDIESVIGRVEANLVRNELDLAVEEAASLKGWPRKLADDWVVEARKRLEAEFLLGLIEGEVRSL